MAPRSPTHAFDPTPALETNKYNYSPLNDPFRLASSRDSFQKFNKEVHFTEPTIIPPQGRHSIATTNVPLLPSVSSASQLPKQSFRITPPQSGIDINAYIENCRNLNEQLRQAHETERRTWEIERSALQARIADLEFKLKKSRDPRRRSSNETSAAGAQAFRADFFAKHAKSVPTVIGPASESAIADPVPVWKGPEVTPPATRVFSNEEDLSHLPSISEDEPFPDLTKEISPTTVMLEKVESVPVPIEQVDKTLDGITLKSAALTSSFEAKITSPQFGSPAHSPSPRPKQTSDGGLHVEMNSLLSPMDEKLKRNAGHTPMLFDGTLSSEMQSTENPTPKLEDPPAPAPTKRPPLRPSEDSDSYFSFISQTKETEAAPDQTGVEETEAVPEEQLETEEDPPLKGPLMLDPKAKSLEANKFLESVDAKLMAAVQGQHDVSSEGRDSQSNGTQSKEAETTKDDDLPHLKIKQTKNFGSAWGGDMPGRI